MMFLFSLRLIAVGLFVTTLILTCLMGLRPSAPQPLLSFTRFSSAASVGTSLWLRDLERGAELRLLDSDRLLYALWTPTGDRIAYFFDDARGSAVYLYDVRSGRTTLGLDIPRLLPLRWSPDGRWLLLYSFSTNQIYAMPHQDGALGEPVYVAAGSADALWSPDGARIYFRDAAAALSMIDASCLERGGFCVAREVPTDRSVEQLAGRMPDGARLMVTSGQRDTGQTDLFSLDPATGETTLVAEYLLPGVSPAWSPDGTLLAVSLALPANEAPSGMSEPIPGVYLIDEGGAPRLLWAGVAGQLTWPQSETRLAFELIARVGNDRSVWVYQPPDDALTRITALGAQEAAPHWVVYRGRDLELWALLGVMLALAAALWEGRAPKRA